MTSAFSLRPDRVPERYPGLFRQKTNENRISAFQGTTENINRKNRKERKSHNDGYATFLFPICRKGGRSFRFVGITSPQHPLPVVQVVRRAIRRSAGSRSYYPRVFAPIRSPTAFGQERKRAYVAGRRTEAEYRGKTGLYGTKREQDSGETRRGKKSVRIRTARSTAYSEAP